MSRHSTNCTATTHFTYEEKRKAGHGTLKVRLGKDSQSSFGSCALCLSVCMFPKVSPSGSLFCKECIYENLLNQKQKIAMEKEKYTKYETHLAEKDMTRTCEKEKNSLQEFMAHHDGAATTASTAANAHKKATSLQEKLSAKIDMTSIEERKKAIKRTSFWVPEYTPETETVVVKPDEKTRDPMNRIPLRLKQLMDVKFIWSTPKEGQAHVLCALTKKEITHQPAVLLRPSGHVILESCLKDMVLPTMRCPLTNAKLKKKDIILLQMGGTGFSAHNKVEAKKYRPSMT